MLELSISAWILWKRKLCTLRLFPSYHPPCDPKPYHKGVCICLSFPTQESPLQIIKWHLNASCSRATKAHSSLFMCSFEDLRVKTYKVLHIHTHQKLKKKGPHCSSCQDLWTAAARKTYLSPKSHQVVFMHCVSSRQALPRSQGSLENVSLSLAGLDMTTMYRWRNFDFQRHLEKPLLSCPTC